MIEAFIWLKMNNCTIDAMVGGYAHSMQYLGESSLFHVAPQAWLDREDAISPHYFTKRAKIPECLKGKKSKKSDILWSGFHQLLLCRKVVGRHPKTYLATFINS